MRALNAKCGFIAKIAGLLVTAALPLSFVAPATTAEDPAVVGQWSPIVNVGIVPIHSSLLPDGRILFFNSTGMVKSWDPTTGASQTHPNNLNNVFCSGHTVMPDGRLLVAGGHISDGVGSKTVFTFDYRTNVWTRLPDMNAGRWYPTTTTLGNGDVMVSNGSVNNEEGVNRLQQVYQANGTVRDLDNAWLYLPLYSYMHLSPNGKVFNSAPYQRTRFIDTNGTGGYSTVGDSSFGYRDAGTSVMYDAGKVMIVGGHDPPTETAEVIDLNEPGPGWRSVASLPTPRRQLNSTVLPDGKVLVTGGTRLPGFKNPDGAMLTGELWDPATEFWTTTASMQTIRLYHSTSLLLPDGRVMTGGGGEYSVGDTTPHPNVEFYSPPYLFKGARPTVSSSPNEFDYGQSFSISTPNAAAISAVTCVRLGSVTHGFDMNQRRVRLSFTQGAGQLTVTGPPNGNIAPPGHYMLFVLNSQGVPSIGKIIRIGVPSAPSELNPPANLRALPNSRTSITLSWEDRSNNESGFRLERSTDGANFAPRATLAADIRAYTDKTVTAGVTYFYRVFAFNGSGDSTPSNIVSTEPLTFDPQGTGLYGDYFDGPDFAGTVVPRIDSAVSFRWGAGSPSAGINGDTFSVRWAGEIQPRYSETYTLQVISDESVRLMVDGQLVVNDSTPHAERAASGTISLVAGKRHTVELRFQEFTGNATCILRWQSASQPLETVPQKFLYPTGLVGTYYDNPNFSAQKLVRNDAPVKFSWGTAAPAPGVQAGTYCVRWKGYVQPSFTQTYTFSVQCTGALRLYIDGNTVIDAWNERSGGEVSGTAALVAGKKHLIVMEYAETAGTGAVKLMWQSPSQPKATVPRHNLFVF